MKVKIVIGSLILCSLLLAGFVLFWYAAQNGAGPSAGAVLA